MVVRNWTEHLAAWNCNDLLWPNELFRLYSRWVQSLFDEFHALLGISYNLRLARSGISTVRCR